MVQQLTRGRSSAGAVPAWALALLVLLVLAQGASAQVNFATSLDSTLVPLPGGFVEPGDTIYVHVANGPSDLIPFNGSLTATIATSRGDVETVYLFETNQDGTYTGQIKSKMGPQDPPVAGNGNLEVRGSDTITLSCAGFADVTATVRTNGTIKLLEVREPEDAANTPAQPLPEAGGEIKLITAGKSLFVRVIDDDRNADPLVQDSFVVTVVSSAGDSEDVTLVETTPDSGIFMALLPTAYALVAPTVNNGILEVFAGQDAIVATYADPLTTNGTAPLPALADVRGGVDGTITLVPSPVHAPADTLYPGDDLRVTIVDTDNFADETSGPGNDTVTVTLTSYLPDGVTAIDRETYEVPEDNLTAGTFLRSIPYAYTLVDTVVPEEVNSGRLRVRSGGTVRATYHDRLRFSGQVDVPVAIAADIAVAFNPAVTPTLTYVSDLNCNGTVTIIKPGDTIYMCVRDANSDLTPDTDRVTVTLATNTPPPALVRDLEQVVLVETGPRTGIFTGTIDSTFGDPIRPGTSLLPGNGMLDVRGRDFDTAVVPASRPQVEGTYVPYVGANLVSYLAVNIDGTIQFSSNGSGIGPKPTVFRAGDRLFVQVADDDWNRDPTALDTITVTFSSFDSNNPPATGPILPTDPTLFDQEIVTLTETGVNTGVFVMSLPAVPHNGIPTAWVVLGGATQNNGIVEVRADGGTGTNGLNSVVVEYSDAERSDGASTYPRDQILVQQGTTGTIAAVDASTNAAPLTGGDQILIRVTGETDNRGNDGNIHDGPGNDTLTVTVTAYSDAAGTIQVDQERVVIGEDGAVEGNFAGFFPTRNLNGGTGTVDNGVLEVASGGSVRVTYTDWLSAIGQPNAPVNSALLAVSGPVDGIVNFVNSQDPYTTIPAPAPGGPVVRRIQPGDALYIRVDDRDAQVVSNGLTNAVTVTVTTSAGPAGAVEDTEVVQCYETQVPGVFIGRLPTMWGDTNATTIPPNTQPDVRPLDGNLQVRGRNLVHATYYEHVPSAARANQAPLDVEVLGEARLLSNGGTHQQQGNNQFRFDGRLQALETFASIRTGNNPGTDQQLSVRAGDPVMLAVVDDDRNADPTTVETFQVQVTAALTGDSETALTLTETGPDTGVFTTTGNGVRTQLVDSNPAVLGDGILQVRQGDTLALSYPDTTTPNPPRAAAADTQTVQDRMAVQVAGNAELDVVDLPPVGETAPADHQDIRAGHRLLITVRDTNTGEPRFDPNVLDTITVTVSSGTTVPNRDLETVQLTETGLDTRVFAGSIQTVYSVVAVTTDGLLQIADTDPNRRIIIVTYVDPQPQTPGAITALAPVVPTAANVTQDTSNVLVVNAQARTELGGDATITVESSQCQSRIEFILGDTLRISVSDPNLVSLPVLSTISVTVTAPSGDYESVVLTRRNGNGPGDFDNYDTPMPTTYDQSIVREDGVVEMVGGATSTALRGEPLTITYLIPLDAQGRVRRPVSTVIRAFTRATVRFAIDRLLSPTSPNSALPSSQPAPQPRYGQEQDLFTKDDTLTIFQANDRIYIRVVDPDRNFPANDPSGRHTVNVTLTSNNLVNPATPGDQEVVALVEQPRVNGETVRGVFIGSIPTANAPAGTTPVAGDGTLQFIGHDVVTGTYFDVNTNVGNACLITSINTSSEVRNDGQITIVESDTGITVQPIVTLTPKPGESEAYLYVRIVDKDYDSDNKPGTDQGPQVVIDTDAGDHETINTFESTTTPGEFRGKIPLVYGRPPVSGSGRIEAVAGDKITACYVDTFNVNPGTSTTRCASAIVERYYGALLEVFVPRTGVYHPPNRLEEFIIPEKLKIRVRDTDQDLTAGRDAVSVTIATNNAVKPDQETLILTETGNATGIFEGEITTAFPDNLNCPANQAARWNNGVLTLVGGDQITITYVDAHDGSGQTNVPTVATLLAAREYCQVVSFSNTAVDNSTVTLANGAKLTVPPGSLHVKEQVTFQLKYLQQYRDEYQKVVPTPLNPAIQLVGDSGRVGFYEIRPTNLVFKKLATIEIPIPGTVTVLGDNTPLTDRDRQRLKVFYFDGFDWQPCSGEFFRDDQGRDWIRAYSNHLTSYTLALDNRPTPSLIGPLLSQITLDKNPFTPNGDGINDNVSIQFGLGTQATVTVKVIDQSGDLVRTLLDKGTMMAGYNTLEWDGRYAFTTRRVPQGIYIIVVKAETSGAKDTQSVGVGVLK